MAGSAAARSTVAGFLLALTGASALLAAAPASSVADQAEVPPVAVELSGSYYTSEEGTTSGGAIVDIIAKGSWAAKTDGSDPFEYTSDTGTRDGKDHCGTPYAIGWGEESFEMPEEPFANGLGVEPDKKFPEAGWKFEISYRGYQSLPGVRQRTTYYCGGEVEPLVWPPAEEQHGTLSYIPKSKRAELEALGAPFEVAPGEQKTVVREFNWTGSPEEQQPEESITYVDRLKLTISVDAKGEGKGGGSGSKGTGGSGKAGGKGKARGKGGSSSAPSKLLKEKTKEKEAAEARLSGDTIWAAAADAASKAGGAIGLLGLALAPTAQRTLASDEKTVKDPPLADVSKLADPHATAAAGAPSCDGVYPAGSTGCKSLAADEKSLLSANSKIAAISAAEYTTISRQSGAIDSGKSAAAEAQAKQFSKLEGELRTELRAQAKAGGEVASLLSKAGVDGSLSEAQMAAGVQALEAALHKQGLSSAEIRSLALKPTAADFLKLLARGV